MPVDERGPASEAMRSGELVAVESPEELVGRWPGLAEAQARTGDAATIAAPLLRDGRPFGVLYVAYRAPRPLDRRRRELARTLATLLAQALERAQRFEEEHALALAFQETLLPARLPRAHRVELAARYRPGGTELQVGGDWYDVIDLEPGRLAVVVGDVVGHGLRAALMMGQLRNAVRAYALEEPSPAAVLERVNHFALSLGDDAFGTVVVAVLDELDGAVRLASAGHLPPVLVPPDGRARLLDVPGSLPVGSLPTAAYAEHRLALEPGARLLLYTDGLVERRDRPLDEGLERLRRAAASAAGTDSEALAELVLDGLLGAAEPDDDVALVVLTLLPARSRLVRELPLDPAALAPLRRELAVWLRGLGASDTEVYDITLSCMEACTNAIEHAVRPSRPLVEVTAEARGEDVVLVVRDHGAWRDGPPRPDRGRGLLFMRTFMDAVEVRRGDAGSNVVLRRRLGAAR
jgi:serine phosphatase RsbU (regulator of sigma subunit)/anti-sigma regulatory factor (Ser/Thr protein kinase)